MLNGKVGSISSFVSIWSIIDWDIMILDDLIDRELCVMPFSDIKDGQVVPKLILGHDLKPETWHLTSGKIDILYP